MRRDYRARRAVRRRPGYLTVRSSTVVAGMYGPRADPADPKETTGELRLLGRAGRAAPNGAAVLGGQVAVGRGATVDGEHRRLRRRGLEADGPGARSPRTAHPRGVRRPGLHLRRARDRARGDGPRAAVRPLFLECCARRER